MQTETSGGLGRILLVMSPLLLAKCSDPGNAGSRSGGDVSGDSDTVAAIDSVAETATETTPDTTLADTTTSADTTEVESSPVDTAQPETGVSEVNDECLPGIAGKGKIGTPCAKDCHCGDHNGETVCYDGFYMEGFRFCTHESDGRSSNNGEYATLQFPGDCFPGIAAPDRPPIYAPECQTVDDCKAIGSAYTHCGTAQLDYHSGGGGTQCPTATSARDLSLKKTCIIATLPPFNRASLE